MNAPFREAGRVASGLEIERRRLLEASGRHPHRLDRGSVQTRETETVRHLVRIRAEARRLADLRLVCSDALAALSLVEEACAEIISMIQLARSLVLRALNAGPGSLRAYDGVSAELYALRAGMLSVANTAYGGRPVFGGNAGHGAAYATSGKYVGANSARKWRVGPDVTVTAAIGPQFFGKGPTDLFGTLTELADALRAEHDPSVLWGAIRTLESAVARIELALSTVTAAVAEVRRAQADNAARATELDAAFVAPRCDSAVLVMRIAAASVTYQVALHTLDRLRQASIFRFLR